MEQEIKQAAPEIKLSLRKKIQDWLVVLQSVWFILLFLVLGLIAFVFVEQGQDMLFAILDDLQWWSFLFSLAALGIWAVQTGFGARLLIMFSDISFYEDMPSDANEKQRKQTEVDARVKYRKKIASRVPRILFLVPFFIMGIGYFRAFFNYQGNNYFMFFSVLVLIGISGLLLYKITYMLYEKKIHAKEDSTVHRNMRALYQPRYLKDLGRTKTLLFLAVATAALLILIYSFLPISALQWLGSVHLITMSFGCWIAILYWIDYLDKRVTVIKFILFAIICVVSYFNDDHLVRVRGDAAHSSPQKNVIQYFDDWYAQQQFASDTNTVSVFFVSAEGGACRSGYWTSMVLAQLQDSLKNFSDHIFSYSSVSGGTLGVNAFNAIHQWTGRSGEKISYVTATDSFYRKDFLAPITGRMVFGEVINLFTSSTISLFDRAGTLEQSWEESFALLDSVNLMKTYFNEATAKGPAIFINSTEVESGKRALLSNVKIDSCFADVVSLQDRLAAHVNYSTAILFSARFPFFSPAAAVQKDGSVMSRRHYVDGGYVENMGNITTMEIISAVIDHCKKTGKRIKPIVVLISNDEPANKPKEPVRFANEGLEPVVAFMNVRTGHTDLAHRQLINFIYSPGIKGEVIQFNMGLDGRTVPMNWFISENAKKAVKSLFDSTDYKKSYGKLKYELKR